MNSSPYATEATAPVLLQPTGVVTLMFTDIENSSPMWATYKDAFKPVLDAHNELLRTLLVEHHGVEMRYQGDGFFLSFERASDAVLYAIAVQQAIAARTWTVTPLDSAPERAPDPLEFRVRIGMHTCEAQSACQPNGAIDYSGAEVNRSARVGAAAHGGQIIVSGATREIAVTQLPPDIKFEDLGVHRLKGVGEAHLWQVGGRGLRDKFEAPNTLDPLRVKLPLPDTPFIGRQAELETYSELLLQPATRLMTLTGFGGMGKTRFALQLAERCVDAFKDGVHWIPLDNVTTGDEMVGRIADQLGLALQPKPTVEEQVWDFHRERQLLLVLDNLEQIEPEGEAARIVYGLLNAGAQVKCLVTSRRDLKLKMQRLVELNTLPPDEAETLFVERARARKATFVRDERNADDITAICRTLDGLPLAIEIAASMTVLLAPRQLLKRLGDQLRVLQSKSPEVPARHLALRATIDWSYNLLTEDGRSLFAQLAIFAGGFTLEAAEAVSETDDIMDGLMELRGHSLLRDVTEPEMESQRLAMLRAVREYALEKLNDPTLKLPPMAERHAAYFLEYVQEGIKKFKTREEAATLDEMEFEFDNLRAALAWAVANDAAVGAGLATAFYPPLSLRGRWAEAGECLEQGRQAALALGDSGRALQARLLQQTACLADDLGQAEAAWTHAQAALELFRELKDQAATADALNLLGHLATEARRDEAAETLFAEALQLWRPNDYANRAKTLHNLARLATRRGDRERAWRLYEESLALRRRAGDERGEANTLSNMGALAQQDEDYPRARQFYDQSLSPRRQLRDNLGIAIVLNNLGDLAERDGREAAGLEARVHGFKRAIGLFVHAERLFHELGSPFETEPQASLHKLQQQLGATTFETWRAEAERCAWEDLV